jgi:hypothetical protein
MVETRIHSKEQKLRTGWRSDCLPVIGCVQYAPAATYRYYYDDRQTPVPDVPARFSLTDGGQYLVRQVTGVAT